MLKEKSSPIKKVEKKPSKEISRELLQSGMTISQIATERSLAAETIFQHLSAFNLTNNERELISAEIDPKLLKKIKSTSKKLKKDKKNLTEMGKLKLRPVYDELDGHADWLSIRIGIYLS